MKDSDSIHSYLDYGKCAFLNIKKTIKLLTNYITRTGTDNFSKKLLYEIQLIKKKTPIIKYVILTLPCSILRHLIFKLQNFHLFSPPRKKLTTLEKSTTIQY